MMTEKYKVVLMDIDGTLLDFDQAETDGTGMVEFCHVAVIGQFEPIILLLPCFYETACSYCYFCFT